MIDLQAISPYHVEVTFPKVIDGTDTPTSFWVETVVLTSLGLTEYANIVGLANTKKTFHSNARANMVSPGPIPTNVTELTALARRIARDYYLYRLGFLDRKYAQVFAWDMEGLSDCVEWTYRLDEVSTRIQRPPWNDLTEELGHLSSVIPPTPGGGGGTTITVREVDLAPTVTLVSTLEFDQVDGYVVSSPAAGVARIDHADASATQRGIVSLVAQTMGSGNKSFVNSVFAGERFDAVGLVVGGVLGTLYFAGGTSAVGLSSPNGIEGVFHSAVVGGTFKFRLRGASSPTQALAIFSCESGDVFATPAFAVSPDGGTTVARGIYTTITTPGTDYTVSGGLITAAVAGGPLAVTLGGTGQTSFTLNAVLLGNGTSPLGQTAAPASGQFLGETTLIPTWKDLPETSAVLKGIVNLVDQQLGAGTKAVDRLGIDTGGALSIAGVRLQVNGKSYFDEDIWIRQTQSILVYNAGVTQNGFILNTNLSQITTQLEDGLFLLQARLDAFLTNAMFDLVHTDGVTIPNFAVNGTQGITQDDVAIANVKGGIVVAAPATGSGLLSRQLLGV